jgi:phosphate transport system substrate-binding protein
MRWLTISIVFLCFTAQAQDSVAATGEKSNPEATATIRISGDPAISALLERWERNFHRVHTAVKFENRLTGPASAMAGLYTDVADIAFTGHELLTSESMAFEWIFHYKALAIEVLSGSLDDHYFAPVFFVSNKNPLSSLTLDQAESVLGCEGRNGKPARTWGDLGVAGEWADKPIHVYAYQTESELGVFIRRKVLSNSYKWNCDMATFPPAGHPLNPRQDESVHILSALRRDTYGIAVANARYTTPDVKIVHLASSGADQTIPPSPQNIIDRRYPLARPFFVYLNREPGKPIRPEIAAFLRFMLSREEQQGVLKDGSFLPLSDAVAREQLAKLD